jgi:amidohydrolase
MINNVLKNNVLQLSKKYHNKITDIRRHIHARPELSFKEVETGQFIASKLAEWGIEHQHGWAENGVVGIIHGQARGDNNAENVVALRADIDALPIQEANEVPYKSTRNGVMHACGHDAHTASLLGAAKILHELRGQWQGTVKLIFQPAEEVFPGGASLLIKEGVLDNPKPKSIIGQHVHPPLAAGKVGMKAGMYMASADEIYVTVRGKGGHGALPHDCVDTVLITCHIITALQQIISRNANPTDPCVLTFGKIESVGGSTNIIPDEVRLMGTFRAMNEDWRFKAHGLMKKMAEGIAESMGGTCEFNILVGYPFLKNDEPLTERVRQFAQEYLGEERVEELPIRLTAEDFAYYSQEMPACFYRLGTGNPEKGTTSPLHTSTFNIDEAALETSIGLMAWIALRELGN